MRASVLLSSMQETVSIYGVFAGYRLDECMSICAQAPTDSGLTDNTGCL